MTRQKSFKTQVRARMDKTGESYTTARRQLLAKAQVGRPIETTDATTVASPDASAPTTTDGGAGVRATTLSDAGLRERSGRGMDEWFALLDARDATKSTHTEIARWLIEDQGIPGWWGQGVAVAYEQARGMRAPGQSADGSFSISASKTVGVSVERLFEEFAHDGLREQWLPGAKVRVRTATAPKSFRADWIEDSTRLLVLFTGKGDEKASVTVTHERLPDAEAAARMKTYWRERLAVLKELLES